MLRLTTPLRRFNTYSRALLAPANKYGPDGKKQSTGMWDRDREGNKAGRRRERVLEPASF
jgi:hypothetical protein